MSLAGGMDKGPEHQLAEDPDLGDREVVQVEVTYSDEHIDIDGLRDGHYVEIPLKTIAQAS